MMKLELKHLAPYLPYGLKYLMYNGDAKPIIKELESLRTFTKTVFADENSKPILRPLSDLQDFFNQYYGCLDHQDVTDYFDEDYLDSFELTIEDIEHIVPAYLPHGTFTTLVKYHFDVFGLIEQGLAISYSEVYNNQNNISTSKEIEENTSRLNNIFNNDLDN